MRAVVVGLDPLKHGRPRLEERVGVLALADRLEQRQGSGRALRGAISHSARPGPCGYPRVGAPRPARAARARARSANRTRWRWPPREPGSRALARPPRSLATTASARTLRVRPR